MAALPIYAAMTVVSLAATWTLGSARLLPADGQWLVSVIAGAAAGLLIVWVCQGLLARFRWAKDLAAQLSLVLGHMPQRDTLVLALCSGVAEELLFRGVLQPFLGLWPTAIVFGAAHLGKGRRFPGWALLATGAGLLFGALVIWCGNLLPAVVAHVLVNGVNLRRLTRAPPIEEIDIS